MVLEEGVWKAHQKEEGAGPSDNSEGEFSARHLGRHVQRAIEQVHK